MRLPSEQKKKKGKKKKKKLKKKKKSIPALAVFMEKEKNPTVRVTRREDPRQGCPRSVFSVSEHVSVLWQSPQTSPELLNWASRMRRHLSAPWAPSGGAPSPASPDRHLEVTLIHWTCEWLVGFFAFLFCFHFGEEIYIYI